jgi:hypothetical protein
MKTRFGYASHIRYLRDLLDNAGGEVTPLPEGPDTASVGPMLDFQVPAEFNTPEKLQELFNTCAEFEWKPEDAGQYQKMADLANVMVRARRAKEHPEGAGEVPPDAIEALASLADELAGKLEEVAWDDEHTKTINGFAGDNLESGRGVFFVGQVVQKRDKAILLKLAGSSDKFVLAPLPPTIAAADIKQKVLVAGTIVPHQAVKIQGLPQGDVTGKVVLSYHLIPVP